MEKKNQKHEEAETPRLRLRRRSIANLSDETLRDVAGGHTCQPSCRGTCRPNESCPQTCGYTCDGADTCHENNTFCDVCPSDECPTLDFHNCTNGCP